jgi:hypothetical protein
MNTLATAQPKASALAVTKSCASCKSVLPLDSFYKKGKDTERRDSRCRVCRASEIRKYRLENPDIVKAIQKRTNAKHSEKHKQRSAKWYRDNHEYAKSRMAIRRREKPDKIRDGKLRASFGISLQEYNEMLELQNHKCAICGTHQKNLSRNLAVDHCHAKGHVRGLLCAPCNTGLGSFRDSATFLQSAIEYINNRKQ